MPTCHLQMEAWALSVERRSMELTRTNRSLRAASEKCKKVTPSPPNGQSLQHGKDGSCALKTMHDAVGANLQEAEFFKAKAERQAELLGKAELARMEADRERARMESKFARTDKGTAMLKAARLKIELEACRERLAELESQVHTCLEDPTLGSGVGGMPAFGCVDCHQR